MRVRLELQLRLSCLHSWQGCDSFHADIVRLNWKRFSFGRTVKTVLASLLVLQMLALLAFAACPTLHHALHPESNNPDHDCLVTLFAKSQLGRAEMTPFVPLVALFVICAVLLPGLPSRLLFEYRFAPCRAPPRF
jgi:hypothetical protein